MREAGDWQRPKVLYVDDQEGNLTVFRASLRGFADIRTTSDPEEALEILREEEFPIVISDQRMDICTGTELLRRVRHRHPDTVRILLTAYADFNAVVEAINDGCVARFVRKPWDREEMCAILGEANRQYWKTKETQELLRRSARHGELAALGGATAGLAPMLREQVYQLQVLANRIAGRGVLDPGTAHELGAVRQGLAEVGEMLGYLVERAESLPVETEEETALARRLTA